MAAITVMNDLVGDNMPARMEDKIAAALGKLKVILRKAAGAMMQESMRAILESAPEITSSARISGYEDHEP